MKSLRSFVDQLLRAGGKRVREIFDLEVSGELVILSMLVGAVTGLAALAFVFLLRLASGFVQAGLMNYVPPEAGTEQTGQVVSLALVPWAVLVCPTLGGLLAGLLVFILCPEAEGHGSDAMVRSFHRLKGAVRARVPFVKGLASIITISSGGSAGREGPIAQVGAGVGSTVAGLLKMSPDSRRHLMLAGAAGGIAAVFQSPLGAALFVCEVLYASAAIETSALLYATISSVSAYAVFISLHGQGHEIIAAKSGFTYHGLHELPFYAAFAPVCSIAGYVYVKTFYGLRNHVFRRLPMPQILKPALGGLLLGVFILVFRLPGSFDNGIPHVMSGGYGWIQQALDGQLSVWWMLGALAGAKILATSLTISSGGSGGVFAPSLFIGAMLGGAYGLVCHELFPQYVTHPQVFVLVGMGAFFAGVAKVPLTAAVMVSEMTGTFNLLVPLMFVCVLNNALLARHVTLYEEQVRNPVDSPVHQGDFLVDILATLRVHQVFDPNRPLVLIPEHMPLAQLVKQIAASNSDYFPVVNDDQRMVGIFSLSDVRGVLPGFTSNGLIVASDIAVSPVISVTPDDDLHTALQRFTQKNIDEIPVVDPEATHRVLGLLRRKELIAAYHDEVERLKNQD